MYMFNTNFSYSIAIVNKEDLLVKKQDLIDLNLRIDDWIKRVKELEDKSR